jgi:hypothetical protein
VMHGMFVAQFMKIWLFRREHEFAGECSEIRE